jgi:ATP-dependent Clp protease ATP-binding subunit ClpC
MLNDIASNVVDYFFVCDIDITKIQNLLEEVLSHDIIYNPLLMDGSSTPSQDGMQQQSMSPSKTLESYSLNLNILAKSGEFDFICANPTYIHKLEETLCRKTKSCALLVGDAGVGKTALIESLAKRIIDLNTNDFLLNKKILSVDLSSMIAGTKYRGQFEERFKSFIEAAKSDKNVVLFIDEIHTIVGAGNAEGSLDAANILKPYIARGEITCIGATTYEEYKKNFADDPALKRRFNPIKIEEPNREESIEILDNLCRSYSTFHAVDYSSEAIVEAVDLSIKYINDRKLPDKAIDLIDQAGASVKIASYKKPKMAKNMEKVLISDEIDDSIKDNVFSSYKKVLNKWSKNKMKKVAEVHARDIRKIISENLNIPIESLNETHSKKLLSLDKRMNKDVIGQNKAIEKISNALFKAHCGLKDPNRPIGSFLFLGKTGTGKTLTSKSLAKHYFGSDKKLIYLDMSEFSEPNSVSKFSGSSPGYVGYEKGGILTEKIKRDPHCVILFDEVEKAHPVVLQSLLQILEEGRLTDNAGDEASFKNTVIILTSNLGADLIDKKGSVGFLSKEGESQDKIFEEAKRKLSPELVNRFDGIVLFNNFKDSDLNKIINIEFNKVKKKLKNKGIDCYLKARAKKQILKETISQNLGGRPIRRIIQNEVEVAIAKFIISNDCDSVIIDYIDNNFTCNAKPLRKSKQS